MKKCLLFLGLFLVFLNGFSQLENADFENWETSLNKPTAWNLAQYSDYSELPFSGFYHVPETNAQSNDYALTLSIWYYYAEDIAIQKAPISYRPTALNGFYKYEDNDIYEGTTLVTDTAQIAVYLTKWDDILEQRDTIGTGILDFPDEQLSYQSFSNAISYTTDAIPDSITVIIEPSRFPELNYMQAGVNGEEGQTSFFTVDNLSLTEENLAVADEVFPLMKMYPNPVVNTLHISDFEGNAKLYNVRGQLCLQQTISDDMLAIDVSKLAKGVYFVCLENEGKVTVRKLIKQ